MKNLYILIFVFSNIISFAQYNNGKIQLNDGNELNGLIKITKGYDVKYKSDDDSKVIEYDNDLIKSFEFTENGILRKFIYSETTHINNEKSRVDKWNKLLEIIIEGKVSLFKYYISVDNMVHTSYYLKKETDKLPLFYYGEGYLYKQKFIPFVSTYFSDCVNLVEKVKAKEFKHKEFKEVVEYYNKECK
jgi:hypothetical protein